MPELICSQCIQRIEDAYSFKILCEESEAKLRNNFIEIQTDNDVCFILQKIDNFSDDNNDCDVELHTNEEYNCEDIKTETQVESKPGSDKKQKCAKKTKKKVVKNEGKIEYL